jgi:predicted ATPase/class 3 adenylate cyclase
VVVAPTGIVTFLFTDIEGSTLRWERDGRAMAEALARHDVVVRAAIAACGGHIFKTVGDAFCSAFADARDAAAAALETQRRLAAENFAAVDGLKVRMALHTGTCHERDGDYFGPTINRVARLLAIGHGGQVLVSSATAPVLARTDEYRDALHDLGEHALKDIVQPERVWELSVPGVPAAFPPLRSAAIPSHNLPLQISSFVGREDDIAAIRRLLRERRGVTLTGTGGVGKTRCALEVAGAILTDYKDGVRYVELAALEDPSLVANAVAAAVGVRESTEEAVPITLQHALAERRILIILDNCEHLLEATARFAEALLGSCRGVSILATSREPLAYAGEALYRMPSLVVPAPGLRLTAEAAGQFSAIALFVMRAKASDAKFELTDENARAVAAIVAKVDGIALAIELAATRLRTMNLGELARRLDERLRVLTTGSRTASARQRTMRGLIDWSWELFSPLERVVFARLCVFATRFSLDAACDLCEHEIGQARRAPEASAPETSDVIAALVDKSVVAVDLALGAGDSGFRIIETLREYGLEKLAAAGETQQAHAALLAWSVALATEAEAAWETMPSQRWEERFGPQLDNVRGALHWSLEERNDIPAGTLLCARLARLFGRIAPFEGRRWTRLALRTHDADDPRRRAELKLAEATVHVALREKSVVLEAGREALAAFEDLGDETNAAQAAVYLGFTLAVSGDPAQGQRYLAPALEVFRDYGLPQSAAIAAQDLAIAHLCAGEDREAQRYFEEALAGFRNLENARGIVDVSINLAELAHRFGRLDEAVALALEAAETPTTDTDPIGLVNLTAYLIAGDRFDEAKRYAQASLERALASGHSGSLWIVVQHLAAIDALRPESDPQRRHRTRRRAASLRAASERLFAGVGGFREFTEQTEYDRLTASLERELGPPDLEAATRDGRMWTDQRIVGEALAT